ncbi:MAG: YcaO-like family protein [Proteobacteria bacterium]|nr:YcaO-like family protein [Pseudomonadota bacterium]MBU1583622.1 YcaO-like family protein [Pseudomonadota bacterium]MBU2454238.1 YcaO-like family protein [Pseudomonadota bacterium]MBU2629732.1 YcaO-like family protein [Pseudomonadota bacterium]
MSYKVELKDALKGYTYDQDKIMSPQETVARFKEKTAQLNLDILSRTRRIDNGRLDIPVFFSECGADAIDIIGTKKQMGKGGTPEQSEASAVMELAERFSFFSFVKKEENFFYSTPKALGEKALSYEQIIKSVHDNKEEALKVKPIFDDLPLKWTQGYNLTKKQEVLIPFNWFYMINEFNGPSAGNCTEEALSQGICELVERHTSSLVSHGNLNVPGINLDSFTDPLVIEMLEKYKKQGLKVYASDFSLDTGIPTIAVLAWDPETFPDFSEIVWTAGTSPDPQKAMSRALTETAQLAGDFNSGSNYVASGLPKFTYIEEARFITHPEKMINMDQLPDLSDNNIKIEVENLIHALDKRAYEIIVINTRHDALEIPAFYAIIPGAHFRERAAAASVGMFLARLITENFNPVQALSKLDDLEKALPGKYYTSFYKGLMLNAVYEQDAALQEFKTALNRNPVKLNMPDIYSHMGACLKDLERYESAVETCKKGLAIDAQRPDMFNTMGFCHFMLKNHETAITCFENALAVDPSLAINYANIGSNYRELGDFKLAIKYYEMALEIDPAIEFAKDNIKKLKNR